MIYPYETASEKLLKNDRRAHRSDAQTKRRLMRSNPSRRPTLLVLFLILLFVLLKQPQEDLTKSNSNKNTSTTSEEEQGTRNMGAKNSSPAKPKTYISSTATIDTYALKKRHAGCSGMFWRGDPENKHKLQNNNNWPRDGAVLKGQVKTVAGGAKWLAATEVKQASGGWVEAPFGAHIPFEYDNHYYLEEA